MMFFIDRNIKKEKISIDQLFQLYDENKIDDSPYYQRYSDLWSDEKKRLLIDTIINGYDMPKFYFHYIISKDNPLNETSKPYAIIDGKQRIGALLDFRNNAFKLDEGVIFLDRPELSFKGVAYSDLQSNRDFWEVKQKIDSFVIDVIHIITDEYDRVEEMFLRLNEGIPVNNAEKRNSIGGYLIQEANSLIKRSKFFLHKVKFGNKRMEHQDLVLKLCLIENSKGIESFTKRNLDTLVKKYKPKKNASNEEREQLEKHAKKLVRKVEEELNSFSKVFEENDDLLRFKGIIPLYYYFIKNNNDIDMSLFRRFIITFDRVRAQNRRIGKTVSPNNTLLQFDRLNQQGAHQAKSLETRLRILSFYFMQDPWDFEKELPLEQIGVKNTDDELLF